MRPLVQAGGKVLKGLERRREAEAALYEMRWY
jgi:GH24 family phage-related lysozyme (muramidase)